jgi:hypothetical protein
MKGTFSPSASRTTAQTASQAKKPLRKAVQKSTPTNARATKAAVTASAGTGQTGSTETKRKKLDIGPICSECGTLITDDIKALQCDRCGGDDGVGVWKCCGCLNIGNEIYDALSAGSPLKWYCEQCEAELEDYSSKSRSDSESKVDKMLEMVGKIMERFDGLDEKLKGKASTESVDKLEVRLKQVEDKIILLSSGEKKDPSPCWGMRERRWKW